MWLFFFLVKEFFENAKNLVSLKRRNVLLPSSYPLTVKLFSQLFKLSKSINLTTSSYESIKSVNEIRLLEFNLERSLFQLSFDIQFDEISFEKTLCRQKGFDFDKIIMQTSIVKTSP